MNSPWLDAFRASVPRHPERPALVTPREQIGYAALLERAEARAVELRAAPDAASPGPGRAPHHVVHTPHPFEVVSEVLACWIAGAVPVVLNETLPPDGVARWRAWLERLDARVREPGAPPPPPDAEGLVMTTSGTMGAAKLVALSHAAIWRNTQGIFSLNEMPPGTRQLVTSPLSHGLGLNSGTLVGLYGGWSVHVLPPQTPPPVVQAHLRENNLEVINSTPSYLRLFLSYWRGAPFESVRRITLSAQPIPAELLRQAAGAFPNAELFITYGMTEVVGRVAQRALAGADAVPGAVGVPLPYLDWCIEPVEGVPAPAGELLLRDGSVFNGYLREDGGYDGRDAAGYFHTGDLVRLHSDGGLLLLGRLDGLVKLGGFLVNPVEVEQVVRELVGVAEVLCAVVPHDILGQVLEASVVSDPGATLEPDAVRRHCRERLEAFKVPRHVRIVESLPTTALGKVRRH